MTTEQKLAAIRQACIAAWNPNYADLTEVEWRPIRLADVLLAIKEKVGDLHADTLGFIFWYEPAYGADRTWNLRDDDLAAQSPETIDFIYNLLI